METQAQELMETSSGQAKYEHQHKAIVWRVPRLPKHGQGMDSGRIIFTYYLSYSLLQALTQTTNLSANCN